MHTYWKGDVVESGYRQLVTVALQHGNDDHGNNAEAENDDKCVGQNQARTQAHRIPALAVSPCRHSVAGATDGLDVAARGSQLISQMFDVDVDRPRLSVVVVPPDDLE